MTGYDPAALGATNLRSTDWATSTIFVEPPGYDPGPLVFQTSASTKLA